MLYRLIAVTALALVVAGPAQAERQTYNPYTTGVTQYQMEREMARQQRQAVLGASNYDRSYNRGSRRITLAEEREVLSIDQQMKSRFPIHPGLYRDAFDRGTWRRATGPGNNPRD